MGKCLSNEILKKWSTALSMETNSTLAKSIKGSNDDIEAKSDFQSQLARITESNTEAYNASKKSTIENSKDDNDRKAVKAAILAQYENVCEEDAIESDEEEDNQDELSSMRILNKEAIANAEQEKREKCRAD